MMNAIYSKRRFVKFENPLRSLGNFRDYLKLVQYMPLPLLTNMTSGSRVKNYLS